MKMKPDDYAWEASGTATTCDSPAPGPTRDSVTEFEVRAPSTVRAVGTSREVRGLFFSNHSLLDRDLRLLLPFHPLIL